MDYHATAAIGSIARQPFRCFCGFTRDLPGVRYVFCLTCAMLYQWDDDRWHLTDGELADSAKPILVNPPRDSV